MPLLGPLDLFVWLLVRLEISFLPCIFLGHYTPKSAYKCFHPETRRLCHSFHVEFITYVFPYKTSSVPPSSLPIIKEFFTSDIPLSHSTPHLHAFVSSSPTLTTQNIAISYTPLQSVPTHTHVVPEATSIKWQPNPTYLTNKPSLPPSP